MAGGDVVEANLIFNQCRESGELVPTGPDTYEFSLACCHLFRTTSDVPTRVSNSAKGRHLAFFVMDYAGKTWWWGES